MLLAYALHSLENVPSASLPTCRRTTSLVPLATHYLSPLLPLLPFPLSHYFPLCDLSVKGSTDDAPVHISPPKKNTGRLTRLRFIRNSSASRSSTPSPCSPGSKQNLRADMLVPVLKLALWLGLAASTAQACPGIDHSAGLGKRMNRVSTQPSGPDSLVRPLTWGQVRDPFLSLCPRAGRI